MRNPAAARFLPPKVTTTTRTKPPSSSPETLFALKKINELSHLILENPDCRLNLLASISSPSTPFPIPSLLATIPPTRAPEPQGPPPPASTSPHHIIPSPPTSALNRSPQFLSAPCSVSTIPALPLQSVPSHSIGPPHHHHTTTTTPSSRLSHAHMQPRKRARLDREIRDRETVKLPLIPHCSCTPLPRIPPVDDHQSIVHRLDDDGDDQGGDGFNGIDCFVCLTLCCLLCMF